MKSGVCKRLNRRNFRAAGDWHREAGIRMPHSVWVAEEHQGNGYLQQIAQMGKKIGPPWGMDQKDAALGALIALRHH